MPAYRPVITGTRHMVSAGHHAAAHAGFTILEAGGNAIDALVAGAFACTVTSPQMTGIGGYGATISSPSAIIFAQTGRVGGLVVQPTPTRYKDFTDNGVTYTVSVVATNAIGNSDASTSASATPMTTPDVPNNVVATAGDTTVAVSWTAPVSDGGSVVTGYTATADDGDGGAGFAHAGSASSQGLSTAMKPSKLSSWT